MARKLKAARPEAEGKSQAEQFIETARRIGADESGETFERAFERIARAKRPASPNARAGPPARKPKPDG
jgi:hypothetical protein